MSDPTDTQEPPTSPENELGHRRKVLSLASDIADLLKDLVDRAKEYSELGVPARKWLEIVAANLPARPASLLIGASSYIAMAIDGALAIFGDVDAMKAGMAAVQPSQEPLDNVANRLLQARVVAKSVLTVEDELSPMGNLAKCFLALENDLLEHTESSHSVRMRDVVQRLFGEAPVLDAGGKPDPNQAPALEVHILLRSGAPIQFSGVLSTTPEGTLRLMTPTKNGDGNPCMIEQFFDYSDVTSVAVVRDVKMTEGSRIVTS